MSLILAICLLAPAWQVIVRLEPVAGLLLQVRVRLVDLVPEVVWGWGEVRRMGDVAVVADVEAEVDVEEAEEVVVEVEVDANANANAKAWNGAGLDVLLL